MVGLGGFETQLREDARHVLLDGALGDDEALPDPCVRQSLGHQREDLALAWRELVVRMASRASEELGDVRIERRSTAGHPFERAEEVAGVGDALLQQVADAVRVAAE
jgi:hypothetical protein